MGVRKVVSFLLLFGFFAFPAEKVYSFTECPTVVFSSPAPMPMPCCGTASCQCAMQKGEKDNFSAVLSTSGDPGKEIGLTRNFISKDKSAPASYKDFPEDRSEKTSHSDRKLYELYSDYRI